VVHRCGICGKLDPRGRYVVDARSLVLCSEDAGYARDLGGEILECSCGYVLDAGNNRTWYEDHRCANCGSTDEAAIYLHTIESRGELRSAILRELPRFREPRVVKALIDVLEDRTARGELKGDVAQALGKIGDPSAIPALKKARPRMSLVDFIVWLSALGSARKKWPPSTYRQWAFDDAIEKLQPRTDAD